MIPDARQKTPNAMTIGQYDGLGRWMCLGCSPACSATAVAAGAPPALACSPRCPAATSAPPPPPCPCPPSTPYFSSHNGRALNTVGMRSKLCSGGGDGIDHSSVAASHGSSPATAPKRTLRKKLYRNTSVAAAIVNAPIVDTRL